MMAELSCKHCGSFTSSDRRKFSNHVRLCKAGKKADCNALKGLVLSFSAWGAAGTKTEDLKAQIEACGGKHSNTTHKRVRYLLASSEAVERRTQGVRKAWKLGVPVLAIEFLAACRRERAHVDPAPFQHWLI